MELSYQVVLIEGHPTWSGRVKHSCGHLLFVEIANGVHNVQMFQIANPQVIPHVAVKACSGSSPGSALTFLHI